MNLCFDPNTMTVKRLYALCRHNHELVEKGEKEKIEGLDHFIRHAVDTLPFLEGFKLEAGFYSFRIWKAYDSNNGIEIKGSIGENHFGTLELHLSAGRLVFEDGKGMQSEIFHKRNGLQSQLQTGHILRHFKKFVKMAFPIIEKSVRSQQKGRS